ncbi:zinc finger protein 883-like [Wyeomyia smithii]|uniref:zinc finger protein 883-like n=1 Tax=Wyeomyia smithii TaxID=174621 RepID=UPI002467BA2C|nr:zinc finger protein 883-like [Wyeomyia smithii]
MKKKRSCRGLELNTPSEESNNCPQNLKMETEELEQKRERTKQKGKFPDVFDEIPASKLCCCGCRARFSTAEELKLHAASKHAVNIIPEQELGGRLQCGVCYKVLNDKKTYNNHQQIGKVNFRCRVCGDIFTARIRVCLHYERLHGPNASVSDQFRTCCGCGKKFDSNDDLKNHSDAVHLPEKPAPNEKRPFVCDVCYHNFPNDYRLYAHQSRRIKYAKVHQCTQCGKTFIGAGLLRDHEIYHSGEKAFQCKLCPMAFSNKDTFRRHVQRHRMPEDKFQCEVCDRRFKTSKNLKEHLILHTGERPLACPHCPARFVRDSCLKFHIRTHTGQKNYPCPQCGKQFPCSSDLNRHVRLFHERQRPYPCFYCPKTYPRKDYRKKHVESVHATELAQNPVPPLELAGIKRWA